MSSFEDIKERVGYISVESDFLSDGHWRLYIF